MKLKKGDTVSVVKGKDRGKKGKIEKVFSKEGKILIASVNQYKRHLKARSQRQPSEIVTLTKPLFISNVMLSCPNCKKDARIGFSFEKNKKKRICRNCGKEI